MNEHNQKALFFCHTHPNLFLQKKCKSCKRGMCHTCIYNNPDYCSDCLSIQKHFSSNYEDKKQILTAICFAIAISVIIALLLFHKISTIPNYPFSKYIVIAFLVSLSVANSYYLFKETDMLSSVNKIPFIGFKLSLFILILVIASGLPILYMTYKSIQLLRAYYYNQL